MILCRRWDRLGSVGRNDLQDRALTLPYTQTMQGIRMTGPSGLTLFLFGQPAHLLP
jgi:hypothetical protein